MAVTHSKPGGCPNCGEPVQNPTKESVGAGGKNKAKDVVIVQQLLNALLPFEGGPDPMLAEDGMIGPKTLAAISKYQRAAKTGSDGRMDPAGPTISRLVNHILKSPMVRSGKLGHPWGSEGYPGSTEDGVTNVAVANSCLRVMEPHLQTLRWKLTHPSTAMIGLLNKHFGSATEAFVEGDLTQVRQVLGSIHHYTGRANAFGIPAAQNVFLYNPGSPNGVIASTVRGGVKLSTNRAQLYMGTGNAIVTKDAGQSIWLTSLCSPPTRNTGLCFTSFATSLAIGTVKLPLSRTIATRSRASSSG